MTIETGSLLSFRNEALRNAAFENTLFDTGDPSNFDNFDNILDPRLSKVATTTSNSVSFICNWEYGTFTDPIIKVIGVLGIKVPSGSLLVSASMYDYSNVEQAEFWSSLISPLAPQYTRNIFITIPAGIDGKKLQIEISAQSGTEIGGFWAGDGINIRTGTGLGFSQIDPGTKTATNGGQIYSNIRTKRRSVVCDVPAIHESTAIGYYDGSGGIIGGDPSNPQSLQDCFMYAGVTRPVVFVPFGDNDMTGTDPPNSDKIAWRIAKTSIYGTFAQEPSLSLVTSKAQDDSGDNNWIYRTDFEINESL